MLKNFLKTILYTHCDKARCATLFGVFHTYDTIVLDLIKSTINLSAATTRACPPSPFTPGVSTCPSPPMLSPDKFFPNLSPYIRTAFTAAPDDREWMRCRLQWVRALGPHYLVTRSRNALCFSFRTFLGPCLWMCSLVLLLTLSALTPELSIINDYKFSQMTTSSSLTSPLRNATHHATPRHAILLRP